MGKRISGIQQVGIGIPDVHKAWKWYRNALALTSACSKRPQKRRS